MCWYWWSPEDDFGLPVANLEPKFQLVQSVTMVTLFHNATGGLLLHWHGKKTWSPRGRLFTFGDSRACSILTFWHLPQPTARTLGCCWFHPSIVVGSYGHRKLKGPQVGGTFCTVFNLMTQSWNNFHKMSKSTLTCHMKLFKSHFSWKPPFKTQFWDVCIPKDIYPHLGPTSQT